MRFRSAKTWVCWAKTDGERVRAFGSEALAQVPVLLQFPALASIELCARLRLGCARVGVLLLPAATHGVQSKRVGSVVRVARRHPRPCLVRR